MATTVSTVEQLCTQWEAIESSQACRENVRVLIDQQNQSLILCKVCDFYYGFFNNFLCDFVHIPHPKGVPIDVSHMNLICSGKNGMYVLETASGFTEVEKIFFLNVSISCWVCSLIQTTRVKVVA